MKTPWFPTSIKPVHVGYYETSTAPKEYVFKDYWNGKRWCDQKKGGAYLFANFYWRGLTEKAK